MRLDLIRHLPVRLAHGVCYGCSDVEAQPAACDAVARFRAALPPGARVLSSPLRRCAQLALAIAPDPAALCLDSRLREMDFGYWELCRWSDINRAEIDAWAAAPWTYTPPGGECAGNMGARALAALDDALAPNASHAVIVAHGGPLRVLLGTLLRLPRERWLSQPFDTGQIVSLQVDPGSHTARELGRQGLATI